MTGNHPPRARQGLLPRLLPACPHYGDRQSTSKATLCFEYAVFFAPGTSRFGCRPNAIFRRRLKEGKQQLVAFVRTLLEGYRDQLRAIDLNRAATLIVNAAEGIGYNTNAETFDELLAEEVTTLFARYLLEPSPPDRDRSVNAPMRTRSSKRGRSR